MPYARKHRGDGEVPAGAAKAASAGLPFPEQLHHAREAALRLLDVRERSAAELRTRLKQKGYLPEVIEAVIARLQESGLQDDARFAELYASDARGLRAWGSRRVQHELQARGLDREQAAAAATENPEAEEERAFALARKRARSMGGLAVEVRLRRLLGMLARRGFPSDICLRVAREVAGTPGP